MVASGFAEGTGCGGMGEGEGPLPPGRVNSPAVTGAGGTEGRAGSIGGGIGGGLGPTGWLGLAGGAAALTGLKTTRFPTRGFPSTMSAMRKSCFFSGDTLSFVVVPPASIAVISCPAAMDSFPCVRIRTNRCSGFTSSTTPIMCTVVSSRAASGFFLERSARTPAPMREHDGSARHSINASAAWERRLMLGDCRRASADSQRFAVNDAFRSARCKNPVASAGAVVIE